MENGQLNQKPHEHKTLLIMLIGIMVIFVLLGIYLVSQKTKKDKDKSMAVSSINNPTQPTITPTPTLIPYAKKGIMKLYTENNVLRFPVGQEVIIGVLASSEKSDIVGFDIVLSYDQNALEFTSAHSQLDSFKAYSYPRTDYVSITMIKSLQETNSTVFDNTDIAQLRFKALKKGTTSIELTAKGNDSTKFADVNAKVTYPEMNKLMIEIY